MQIDCPSLVVAHSLGCVQPTQSGSLAHDRAQVPFGRHACAPGQGQGTVWLQLLTRRPHPEAQVLAGGSGMHTGGGGGPGGGGGGTVAAHGLVMQAPA